MSDLTIKNSECVTTREDDIFSFLPPVDPFSIKKDQISAELGALMLLCGKSRTIMAEDLECKKSRISSILSGKNNLTIKTIWDFVSKLDYEFDVVFRKCDAPRPRQPWNSGYNVTDNLSVNKRNQASSVYVIEVQTQQEVEDDIQSGRGKKIYLSVMYNKVHDENSTHREVLDARPFKTLPGESSFFMANVIKTPTFIKLSQDRK